MKFLTFMRIDHLTQAIFWLDCFMNTEFFSIVFTVFAFTAMIMLNMGWKYEL
jgi:hypothetical protein